MMYKILCVLWNLLTVILSGLLAFINLSEWYVVKIQKQIDGYPFGDSGPTPYFYKTSGLYAMTNFVWGSLFFIVFFLAFRAIMKRQQKLTLVLFSITILLILMFFIHRSL